MEGKKVKKVIVIAMLISILLLSLTGIVFAQKSQLQTVLDRGYLIVGTGSANVPWHFMDEKNELVGFDIDMARILAIGLFGDPTKVKFVEQSPDARIPNLLTDKVDIVIQFMTVNSSRAQLVCFSIPYYVEGTGLILPAGGKYKNYEEMVAAKDRGEKITIAVLQNVDAAERVQQALEGAVDAQYENQGLVYQAINSGRADAGAVDLSSIMWLASREPEKYLYAGFAFWPMNYACAMRPNDQVWINFVNSIFMEAMCGEQYKLYNDAYAKWFGVELSEPKIGKPAIYR